MPILLYDHMGIQAGMFSLHTAARTIMGQKNTRTRHNRQVRVFVTNDMKFSSKTDPFLRPDLTHLSQTVIRRNLLAISLFQSTHPRRMWHRLALSVLQQWKISIHTSMKNVTLSLNLIPATSSFQSTHPRRMWLRRCCSAWACKSDFNPHIHEGCDGLKKNTHICSARSLCSANRFLPNLFLSSSLRLTMLKALFQRQRNGSVHFMFDCNCQESV